MQAHPQVPESTHFRIEQMADGVYAVIHIDGGAAIGNAGIVDLGDRTLVYDSLLTPQAAEDLRAAAEGLFDRPIDMVIDSHWHNDHIGATRYLLPAPTSSPPRKHAACTSRREGTAPTTNSWQMPRQIWK